MRVELTITATKVRKNNTKNNTVALRGTSAARATWKNFQEKNGHGRTGQVKEASFATRSISLLEKRLNRGSAIDFINAVVDKIGDESIKKLNKGNFIFGGASEKEIQETFKTILPKINSEMLKNLKPERNEEVKSDDGSYMPLQNYRS